MMLLTNSKYIQCTIQNNYTYDCHSKNNKSFDTKYMNKLIRKKLYLSQGICRVICEEEQPRMRCTLQSLRGVTVGAITAQ